MFSSLRLPLGALVPMVALPQVAQAVVPEISVAGIAIQEIREDEIDVTISVRNESVLKTGEIEVELQARLAVDRRLRDRHEEVGRWTLPIELSRAETLAIPLTIHGPITHDSRCYPFIVARLTFDGEHDTDASNNVASTDFPDCDEVDLTAAPPLIPFLPSGFVVLGMWWASDLGLPDKLGALMIPSGGRRMFVVAGADTYDSAVYSLAISREPSGQIRSLGTAQLEWHVRTDPPIKGAIGMSAGLELDHVGRLTYTSWGENELRERPYDPKKSFSPSNRVVLRLDSPVVGLTRSPHHDQWMVGSWPDPSLWLLPESDFLRFSSRFFARLDRPAGGLTFVPAGPWTGHLLIADWHSGEIRRLVIDPESGDPIDADLGLPVRGTHNPVIEPFASGIGRGPWGLEFDARTDDLLVSTWTHEADDLILLIHGEGLHFEAPVVEDITLTTVVGEPVSVDLVGSDPDTPTLRYEILGDLLYGELRGTAPHVVYVPTLDVSFSEEEVFTYVATDGTYTSAPGTVTIDVYPRPNRTCAASPRMGAWWLVAIGGLMVRRRRRRNQICPPRLRYDRGSEPRDRTG